VRSLLQADMVVPMRPSAMASRRNSFWLRPDNQNYRMAGRWSAL